MLTSPAVAGQDLDVQAPEPTMLALMDALAEPAALLDAAGEIAHINPAAVRAWGAVPRDGEPGFLHLPGDALRRARAGAVERCTVRVGGAEHEATLMPLALRGEPAVLVRVEAPARSAPRGVGAEADHTPHILENIRESFFAVDRAWRFTLVNRHAESLWGRPRAELLGRVVWDEFPGLRESPFGEAYLRAARTGEDTWLEEHAPETGRWYEARAYPSGDGLAVFFHDVTDLKRAEEALRERERLLSSVLEGISDPVFLKDREGRFMLSNGAHLRVLGRTADEVLGRTDAEILPPEAAATNRAVEERIAATGTALTFEQTLETPAGARSFLTTKAPWPGDGGPVAGVLGVARDVTELMEAERALWSSQQRLALVLESTHDAPYDWNVATGATSHSPRLAPMLGYRQDEIAPTVKAWSALVHPDDLPGVRAKVAAHLSGATPHHEAEYRLRRADGEWAWVLDRGKVVERAADGTPLRMVGALTGIDDRKRMEAALVASERDYRGLFENAHDAILLLDPEHGRVLEANARACEAYGLPHGALVGHRVDALCADPAAHAAHIVIALRGAGVHEFEATHQRADGTPLFLEVRASAVQYGGRRAVLSVNRDIGARRSLEEQLRQAQKMEAVGRLAGGIAHDFNNVLMAVSGHTSLLLRQAAPDDPAWWSLNEIRQGADRAAALTRQLLAFSRRQVLQPRVLDLNAVVAGMRGMLDRLLGEDVELATALDPALGSVRADQGQIEQVLMNLAVNARDAMPDGGVLRISTADVELTAEDARLRPEVHPGPYVRVEVEDTGVGISEEAMAHLFEPFFTTKPVGEGTGLGLAMVYGIVKQSGGYVWAESTPGVRTVFGIYLPRLAARAEPAPLASPAARPAGGRETVLLVEDDRAVRVLARTVLAGAGYTVLEAGDGEEALRVAAAHADPLHLLLTDMVMPGMRGAELARRLAAERPGLAVLYMSGYSDAFHRPGAALPDSAFIQKPVDPDGLLRRVRQRLDGR